MAEDLGQNFCPKQYFLYTYNQYGDNYYDLVLWDPK